MLFDTDLLDDRQQALEEALETMDVTNATRAAEDLSSTEIARVLSEAPTEAFEPFLTSLESERAGRALGQLPPQLAAEVLQEFDTEVGRELFDHIPPDNAADILPLLDEEDRESLITTENAKFITAATELQQYDPESAGGVMTAGFLAVERSATVSDALAAVRRAPANVT